MEVKEAIREGNRKFSDMTTEKMNKEDELVSKISKLEAKAKRDSEAIQGLMEEASSTELHFQDELDRMSREHTQKEEHLKAS